MIQGLIQEDGCNQGRCQEFLCGVQKFKKVWVALERPTTVTKSLDLHDYHKCHRSTLGVRDPEPMPRRRHWMHPLQPRPVDSLTFFSRSISNFFL